MDTTIIETMCRIAEKMKSDESANKFSIAKMDNASEELLALSNTLGLNQIQAVLLTAIVKKDSGVEIRGHELAYSLGLDNLGFLKYHNELETLKKKHYIRIDKKRRIVLPIKVLETLLNNRPVEPTPTTGLGANGLLLRIKEQLALREDGYCSTDEVIEELNELMELNPQNSVSRTVRRVKHDIPDREVIVLYGLVYLYYFEDDDMVGWHDLNDYLTDEALTGLKTDYKYERLSLQKDGVIEYAGRNSIISKDYFKLNDDIKEHLFADVGGIRKEEKKVAASRKVEAADIPPKTLFYNAVEQRQVEQLKELMSKERLDDIRSRMKEKGLRTGFTCLFYGGPGTGKTETVYQIARECGRSLFIVDVSQIKSCWVGESEKNIKKVFDKYKEAVKAGGLIPILLFNEADAIFGVRREGAEDAVDKMENSIQNIILQEMEDLDGILIATTNLTTNLDKAFERRFLYKIRFEKPSREARVSIWRTMLPHLSETEAIQLAIDYDFSGGQIENIVRKWEVKSIIDASDPSFADVRDFCSEELIGNNAARRKIGF